MLVVVTSNVIVPSTLLFRGDGFVVSVPIFKSGSVTPIKQVANTALFEVEALITVVPELNAVTLPSESTLATDGLVLVHVIVLSVAFEGLIVAIS